MGFSPEALELLQRYSFPGNVRELGNVVERAAVLCRRATIGAEDLPPHVSGQEPSKPLALSKQDEEWVPMTLEEALKEPERQILLRALKANNWNRQKTAEQLGVNRTTLYKRLKVLGLQPEDERAA